jgi:hypothetical protein
MKTQEWEADKMAIKILSGILDTRRLASGNAVIDFSDHTVRGDLLASEVHHKQTIGPSGSFQDTPCKVVSLREITMHETDEAFPTGRPEIDNFRIDDSRIDRDHLRISWTATGRSRIEEISYLVVGITQDPLPDVQRAIDNLPDEGGIVHLPPGIYRIEDTIRLADRRCVTLQGYGSNETMPAVIADPFPAGTVLTWDGPDDGGPLLNLEGVENVRIADISFHGPGKSSSSTAIGIVGSREIDTSSLSFERVTFSYFGTGIHLSDQEAEYVGNVDCSRIADATFRSCGTGISFNDDQVVGWVLDLIRFIDNDKGIHLAHGGGFAGRSMSFSGQRGAVGVDLAYISDAVSFDGCTWECGPGYTAIRCTSPGWEPTMIVRIDGGRIDGEVGETLVDWRSDVILKTHGVRMKDGMVFREGYAWSLHP